MLKAGVQWWCCRTATAALTVLYRAAVPLSGWKPPPLEAWEEPVSDPDHMIWAPQVLAQWREDRARWREAAKARRTARTAPEAQTSDNPQRMKAIRDPRDHTHRLASETLRPKWGEPARRA